MAKRKNKDPKQHKFRDIDMIISDLSYIKVLPDKNIFAHSKMQICNGNLKNHYKELEAQHGKSGITQVGPKIAAFYLRDLVSICELTNTVDNESAFCLQAIDIWVKKVAEKHNNL